MKIAIYPAKTDWAFGQIYRSIKKYSRNEITLFDTTDDINKLQEFDLVHIPTLVNHVRLLKAHPELIGKTCVSIHGKAELYNYNPITDEKRTTSNEEIDSGILPKDVITYINRLRRISCVSDELVQLLEKNTNAEVYKISCGVDRDIFNGNIVEHPKLTVICPMSKSYMKTMLKVHGYDAKRYGLILEVEKRLSQIDFVYPDKLLSIDEIAEFYKKGDIIICLSHSEGNPLGIIEAGMMGVLPITTQVGIVPELIQTGINGICIGKNDIVNETVLQLEELNNDRDMLFEMRKAVKKTMTEKREWGKVIEQWDNYFDAMNQKVFVEIGANCFDTLISYAKDGWTGIMVEPVKEYFDKIEQVRGVFYEQVAIGTNAGSTEFSYLSAEIVLKHGMPHWALGLGSLGSHPTIAKNGWENLISKQTVDVIPFNILLERNFVGIIDLLKIDTEGFDCEILKQVDLEKVDRIVFEHVLCKPNELERETKRLQEQGFILNKQGDNVRADKCKVAVCIPSSSKREVFLKELLDSLDKQTFKGFKTYIVKDVSPIGKAKHDVVEMALKDNPKYISMIDDDDLIGPKYLEKVVNRLDVGEIDWCFTWGNLFGDRTGYIHGEIQSPEEMKKVNHQPSWFTAKAEVFRKYNYRENISYAEDMDLWFRLYEHGYKGDVIKEELYLKRWHNESLTITHNNPIVSGKEDERSDLGIKHFTFHIPGYVHLPASKDFFACAFTAKVYNLCKMLTSLGHTVYLYSAEDSTAPCTEFIQTHSLADIRRQWGDGDNRYVLGYDHKSAQFRHDFNSERTPLTLKFYDKCVEEINKRKKSDDFLLIMQGYYHKPIADKISLYKKLEPGIGYRGSCKEYFRGFESSYIYNFTRGSESPFQSVDGSYYDRIFGNYFDPDDYEFSDSPDDYYLYLGRLIQRKGVMVAVETTQAIGAKLMLAGQKDDEINVNTLPKHCEFVGFADIEKRKKLLSHAIATFTPTSYLDPFCGVHVESMISGAASLTTDFGVFPETIPDYLNGKVGFRCSTLQDFCDAAIMAKAFTKDDRTFVRKYSEKFWIENVKWRYQKWFEDVDHVFLSTLDSNVKGWHYLSNEIPEWKKHIYSQPMK